jgi:ketosteroid isomerase-like protein
VVPDPPSENVQLLLRVYGVWHSGDLQRILEFLDPEFEWVNPDNAVDPGIRRGHDGFTLVMRNLEATFAHQDHVLGDYEELGEGRVLWHTIFHARGHSGAAVDVPEQHLWTLRDGKVLRLQWFHNAEEARRAADAADREVEESLDERLRAGYQAFNDGRVNGILPELEPDVEMVISMGGPEGTTVFRGHAGMAEWAREMGDVWRDIQFEPLEVEVEPSGRRALAVVRVSTRGRASDMGLEGTEGHVVTLGPAGKVSRLEGFRDLDLARAAFEGPSPGL